ncbi:MAG: DeoR/GlpR transcriptional regulator [Spirochaetales bacterium]|nr:DeoR/GlpR transcriptional regulator [Spirochaetales bacterium]
MEKPIARHEEIIRLLEINNLLTVKELSKLLEVSHMTVRRDLKALEARRVVSLIHGGAALSPCYSRGDSSGEYELPYAQSSHIREKTRIGLRAAALPRKGDTVILDSGSTTEAIARALPSGSDITVICFALNILMQVYRRGGMRIVFPGGRFHENTLMFEAPESLALIKNYRAAYGFISASGIDAKLGITCATAYETAAKQASLASSKHRVLVADASKFGKVGQTWFADFQDFDMIITDSGVPEEYRRLCEEKGIELVITDTGAP